MKELTTEIVLVLSAICGCIAWFTIFNQLRSPDKQHSRENKMTNEEVMQLMTDMDLHDGGMENWKMDNAWVAFANKVAKRERAACIKLLEDFSKTDMVPVKDTWRMGLIAGANAIRARGEK